MSHPIISVVMPVFNGERFLREAIESILGQSVTDFEFVVIDDGSQDSTAAILNSYQERDPRIRIVTQVNMGLTASLNKGCAMARGKYIARMDSDDVALPDRLRSQLEFMEANPRVGLVGGGVTFIDSSGKVLGTGHYPSKDRELREALFDLSVFWHPATFFRRELFQQVGGYRTIPYAEDYDLWTRMADKAQLANLESVILKYRIHPNQVSVSQCRQQAFGAIAVQTAAARRRNGEPDPLESDKTITLEWLTAIGVSKTTRHTTLARGYLSCIRNMIATGEFSLAAEELQNIPQEEIESASDWVIADLYLMRARVFAHQKQFARATSMAVRASLTRPLILARPIKKLFLSILSDPDVGFRAAEAE